MNKSKNFIFKALQILYPVKYRKYCFNFFKMKEQLAYIGLLDIHLIESFDANLTLINL